MNVHLEHSWKQFLGPEFDKPYFANLTDFIRHEYSTTTVFPPAKFIFNSLDILPVDKVKVVILGQDPYHSPGQAHGLSFSVPDGVPLPPSLINIYKELKADLMVEPRRSGDLTRWAKQGVLLLNSILTVRSGQAASHHGRGWELFTDAIVKKLSALERPLAFVLWGNYAQKKGSVIDSSRHLVIRSAHPSPLSAHNGFFGSKPFSKVNCFLTSRGCSPISWV